MAGRQSILTLNRSEEFQSIVEQVLEGRHAVKMMEFQEEAARLQLILYGRIKK